MDTIGDRIKPGDRVVCETPDPGGRLTKGRAYHVGRTFSADRQRIVVLREMPSTEWSESRFAKAPTYGWFGGYP